MKSTWNRSEFQSLGNLIVNQSDIAIKETNHLQVALTLEIDKYENINLLVRWLVKHPTDVDWKFKNTNYQLSLLKWKLDQLTALSQRFQVSVLQKAESITLDNNELGLIYRVT